MSFEECFLVEFSVPSRYPLATQVVAVVDRDLLALEDLAGGDEATAVRKPAAESR